MTERCPVCKNDIKATDKACSVCGFADLHKEFITVEDGELWNKEVVEPYKKQYEEAKKNVANAGFDADGYNKLGFDRMGYNRAGFDKDGFDRQGYDKEGFYKLTGYNRDGYDRSGFNRSGYDKDGFDKSGFNREGYDHSGFDHGGYNKDGYDKNDYDKDGFYRLTGRNRAGFDREGYDVKGYNDLGFNRDGYNRYGFNAEGYNCAGFDKDGYDREGFDKNGYSKTGYNRSGFDKNGYDKDGYNSFGFNKEGYNKDGFDKDGISKLGVHQSEFGADGYHKLTGYDVYGYDRKGYDVNGIRKKGWHKEQRQKWWRKNKSKFFLTILGILAIVALFLITVLFPIQNSKKGIAKYGEVLEAANVGETVTFGRYEQDNNKENGKEDIEWIVVDKNDNRALLISKYSLDSRKWHRFERENQKWSNCSLRNWLNITFIHRAFVNYEEAIIVNTLVKTEDVWDSDFSLLKEYGHYEVVVDGGRNVRDKIFLLSKEEVSYYSLRNTEGSLTQYAENINSKKDGLKGWWLRSPGYDHVNRYKAAHVDSDGDIDGDGDYIDENSGIRPAMWVRFK